MALFPERQQTQEPPEGVTERPETLPEKVEKLGVSTTQTQFSKQVTDDQGLVQTPQTQATAISIPHDQASLDNYSKGSIIDSITWRAMYFLRMVKKAVHFGWRVTFGGGKNANTGN